MEASCIVPADKVRSDTSVDSGLRADVSVK